MCRAARLFVPPTGTRSWVQRIVIRCRRLELGHDGGALAPLDKAREQTLANRMLARSDGSRTARTALWIPEREY